MNLSLAEIDGAAALIGEAVPPTPAYRWPLLCERTGAELWLKHENHTPLGWNLVTPPSVPGASWLRRRMLANVPRTITSWLPRREP